jgi:hypothetical protein
MKYTYLTLLAGVILISGCATSQVQKPTTDQEPPASDSNAQLPEPTNSGVTLLPAKPADLPQPILACESYSKADQDGQKKQWLETQQILSQNKQDVVQRIKLACIYALPSSYLKDATKAHTLLSQLREEPALNATEKAYINHLFLFNVENIKQQQKIKDEARSLDTLTQKYDTLQKKYDAVEQKLIHLKNIEKSLNVR